MAEQANLVQEIVNLFKLLLRQFARVHALDLSPEVLELVSVGGRGKGNWSEFDGHGVRSVTVVR